MKIKLLTPIIALLLVHFSSAQIPKLYGPASGGGYYGDGAIVKINGDGSGFSTVCSPDGTNGSFPAGHLVLNSDGMFYGMAFNGGAHNSGVIFRVNPATNAYKDLYDLDSLGGAWVNSDLVRANDSVFYGLIYEGGADSLGQLFSFNISDSAYTILYHFSLGTGTNPRNIMMDTTNKKLYGTNDFGGAYGSGNLFSYDPAANTYAVLQNFDSTRGTGAPVQATDGTLYGMTSGGGIGSWGTIYSYDPVYATYTKLHDFDNTNGYPAWSNSLIQGTDGSLYGITNQGGNSSVGTLFNFIPTYRILTKLYDFTASSGNTPIGSLIQASDGKLYGMTNQGGLHGLGTLFSFDLGDSTFADLKDLTDASGSYPYGSLTELPVVTGIAEQTFAAEMNIYPNPVTNQLVLHTASLHSSASITVSVMNTLGEVILTEKRAWENNLTIDTKMLPAGFYFVQVKNESTRWVGRFVKE